jgi:hypothetical protein
MRREIGFVFSVPMLRRIVPKFFATMYLALIFDPAQLGLFRTNGPGRRALPVRAHFRTRGDKLALFRIIAPARLLAGPVGPRPFPDIRRNWLCFA